jgi:1-acyl-sn-glycerol-3-phosphate acyltransferase
MFYWMVKALLRPAFQVFFSPRIEGAEHIPRRGGVILASNHLSMCDSLFLPAMTRRRVTFLAKIEYFTGRGPKGRAKAAFVRWTGLIPIHRDDPTKAAAALRNGISALRTGRVLCVYPEGTRSPDGRLYRGKTGAARMALEASVPIVPVAMIGTDVVQPIGTVRPRRAPVTIRVGRPVAPPDRRPDDVNESVVLREFTDRLMASIAALSGQEQVDVDSSAVKRARPDAA